MRGKMKKIILIIMMILGYCMPACLGFSVDETKWQRVEADCDLFVKTASIVYDGEDVCRLTVLMAKTGDSKYLISDYAIYRDSRTIVTQKHNIYDYDTDRKLHTVQYPTYSPKHVPIELHGAGKELYEVAFGK